MKKKVLVTGHNGYIGALLVPLLLQAGHEVVGLDTNYFDDQCEFYHEQHPVKVIKKDLRRIEKSDLQGIDVICHLAALSNDPIGQLDAGLTNDINYLCTIQLAQYAKEVGVSQFIYSSSCSLYGKAGDEALDETAPFNPITEYAKSKVNSENGLMPLADEKFCVTCLRNATAYGVSPKLRLDLVVNDLVAWAILTRKIKIMSDGTPWRPLVHAEDIARAFMACIETPAVVINKQAFNVGIDSDNFRIKEIAEIVKQVVPGCEIVITGEHGSDSRSYRVNFGKIKKQLPAFKPAWTLQKGIEDIYRHYLEYKLDDQKFYGRYFVRLRQLKYLMDNQLIDSHLFWANLNKSL